MSVLSKAVVSRVVKTGSLRTRAFAAFRTEVVRFQSNLPQSEVEESVKDKVGAKTTVVSEKKVGDGRDGRDGRRGKNRRSKYPPLNGKLRDISIQVRKTVESSPQDLMESFEILEEGLSYLRGIQQAENISEESLYSLFQPISVALVKNLIKNLEKSTGTISMDELLDMLVKYNVAHTYHFTQAMVQELKSNNDLDLVYHNILNIWVKYLEYSKTSTNDNHNRMYNFLRQDGFRPNDIKNLAFYAYVQSCLKQGIKYDFKDALKLLQSDTLPEAFQVRKSVTSLGLTKTLSLEFQTFNQDLEKVSLESLDPNGTLISNKIATAITHNDANLLDKTYEQILQASAKNSTPINESTLIKLLDGYYECQQHSKVFEMFQQMIQNGISKPSIASWEFVIRSMGHPSYIKDLKEKQRDSLVTNIDRLVDTIVENGTELTPKTLAILVGSFANLDRFDKVDQALQKYSVVGDGTLPVIHAAKNNMLIGLLVNQKIGEAEIKLKELMNDGSNYKPSSTTMNNFLNYYAKNHSYKSVDGILKFMKNNQIQYDVGTYTILTDVYFKLHREKGLVPDIQELLTSFEADNTGDVKLNQFTISTIIDGLVKDGSNLEAARTLLDQTSKFYKPSAETLTSMIKGELDFGSVSNAQILFEKYIKSVRNESRIWNLMIKSLLVKHEGLALEYYDKFKEASKLNSKSSPNFYTYYFLLTHFLKRGKSDQVQYILDELSAKTKEELGYELPKIIRSITNQYKISDNLLHEINRNGI